MSNSPKHKETSEPVKRHVKEKLFQQYAVPAPKPKGGEIQGRAQRAWLSWDIKDRTLMLEQCGVPRNQAHLFYDKHWLVLSLYLKREIKNFMRKAIPHDHPLYDLRYGE